MGAIFMWFQGDDIAELEKVKQRKLEQIEELKEEVKAIDEKIEKLKG